MEQWLRGGIANTYIVVLKARHLGGTAFCNFIGREPEQALGGISPRLWDCRRR